MLLELSVQNWAVVADARLVLDEGFIVVTGETGAGKSLLVDALGALLGTRADQDVVRTGADVARVEGIFHLSAPTAQRLAPLLAQVGVEGEELVVVREVHKGGRSIARINGQAVPISFLRQLGGELVDIHGQAEHLSLLDKHRHLYALDAFGKLEERRAELNGILVTVRRLRHELASWAKEKRQREQEKELLEFQVREIEAACLRPGEDEELKEERERLAHVQALKEACQTAYHALYAAEGYSAFDMIGRAQGSLRKVAHLDHQAKGILEMLEALAFELEEAAGSLRSFLSGLQEDPRRLEQVEERLEVINRLKRKYGPKVEDILRYLHDGKTRLQELEMEVEREEELKRALAEAEAAAGQLALLLSQARQEVSRRLEMAVTQQLSDLGMGGMTFKVEVSQQEDPEGLVCAGRRFAFTDDGVDQVEFLVSTNPGEPLRPLARIASGGELSRFMLALESAMAAVHPVPVLVFDEIDVGVGGRSAEVVAHKLCTLARNRQVICITHLPQIAAYADVHFRVRKDVVLGRAFAQVERLEGEERLRELAAMLGGPRPTERMLAGARELLARARAWRKRVAI